MTVKRGTQTLVSDGYSQWVWEIVFKIHGNQSYLNLKARYDRLQTEGPNGTPKRNRLTRIFSHGFNCYKIKTPRVGLEPTVEPFYITIYDENQPAPGYHHAVAPWIEPAPNPSTPRRLRVWEHLLDMAIGPRESGRVTQASSVSVPTVNIPVSDQLQHLLPASLHFGHSPSHLTVARPESVLPGFPNPILTTTISHILYEEGGPHNTATFLNRVPPQIMAPNAGQLCKLSTVEMEEKLRDQGHILPPIVEVSSSSSESDSSPAVSDDEPDVVLHSLAHHSGVSTRRAGERYQVYKWQGRW